MRNIDVYNSNFIAYNSKLKVEMPVFSKVKKIKFKIADNDIRYNLNLIYGIINIFLAS